MKIGLVDVDGHNFPNLPLMKISAYHKAKGDDIEMFFPLKQYDRVYMSKVFDDTYTSDMGFCIQADEVVRGGTGYGLDSKLPDEIEHIMPDYALYGITNTAYGFLTRGCPNGKECKDYCIVSEKEGFTSQKVADILEFWDGQKNIVLLDPNILACRERMDLLKQLADTKAWVDITQGTDARLLTEEIVDALNHIKISMIHFAWDHMAREKAIMRGLEIYRKFGKLGERDRRVYVLVNLNTTMEENLYRVYTLREMTFDPYIMIFDKGSFVNLEKHRLRPMRELFQKFSDEQIDHFKQCWRLQRWVNNKWIFRTCERFEDYERGAVNV